LLTKIHDKSTHFYDLSLYVLLNGQVEYYIVEERNEPQGDILSSTSYFLFFYRVVWIYLGWKDGDTEDYCCSEPLGLCRIKIYKNFFSFK
jgi:hypothetical protein